MRGHTLGKWPAASSSTPWAGGTCSAERLLLGQRMGIPKERGWQVRESVHGARPWGSSRGWRLCVHGQPSLHAARAADPCLACRADDEGGDAPYGAVVVLRHWQGDAAAGWRARASWMLVGVVHWVAWAVASRRKARGTGGRREEGAGTPGVRPAALPVRHRLDRGTRVGASIAR